MNDNERIESARAQREAVDATVSRSSRGPVARAIQGAMAKYLASQQYREAAVGRHAEPTTADDGDADERDGSSGHDA